MSSPWDPQPPHGRQPQQPQQYRGFGAFQQPPPPVWQSPHPPPQPPKKPRGPLILALVVSGIAVLALIAAFGVTFAAMRPNAPAPASGAPSVPTSVATQAPAKSQQAPLITGWQVVDVPQRGAVYDVPPGWQPAADPEGGYGYGTPQDAVTLTGVANFQPGFCPGQPTSFRATAGVTARTGPNDVTVATETSQKFATLAYTRRGVAPIAEPAPPETVQLPGGGSAVRINTKVTLPTPDPCDAPVVVISVLATNNDGKGSVVLIAAADQAIPDATPQDALNQIAGSLRPR